MEIRHLHPKRCLFAMIALVLAISPIYAASIENIAIAEVDIVNFAYQPPVGVSAVGRSVTWTNRGSMSHTVTFLNGAADSGVLAPSETFTFTFTQATRYSYTCTIHPSMTGYVDALPPPGQHMQRSWLPLVAHV